MKTVLVSGGAGLIGSHLCKSLLEAGSFVLCLDNLSTGSRHNILSLVENPNFEFIRHDVIVPILIEADEIYHLACPAARVHYHSNPIKRLNTSINGTINMLEMARRLNARFLLASTSRVYGDPGVHPQMEAYNGNVNPVGPRACYDEGKRAAETLTVGYRDYNGVAVRIARIFNTYGPRMLPNDGRVVSNFICQALKGHDITIYGDGLQTRSFCYVSDLVDGLIRLMNAEECGPVNLGNPIEVTIKELAVKILEMIPDSSSAITYKSLPIDDPTRRKPDISLARSALKWKPLITLEDGLDSTISYFMEKCARTGEV